MQMKPAGTLSLPRLTLVDVNPEEASSIGVMGPLKKLMLWLFVVVTGPAVNRGFSWFAVFTESCCCRLSR